LKPPSSGYPQPCAIALSLITDLGASASGFTARIERGQVLSGLMSEYRRATLASALGSGPLRL